jgi:hypothetical protein
MHSILARCRCHLQSYLAFHIQCTAIRSESNAHRQAHVARASDNPTRCAEHPCAASMSGVRPQQAGRTLMFQCQAQHHTRHDRKASARRCTQATRHSYTTCMRLPEGRHQRRAKTQVTAIHTMPQSSAHADPSSSPHTHKKGNNHTAQPHANTFVLSGPERRTPLLLTRKGERNALVASRRCQLITGEALQARYAKSPLMRLAAIRQPTCKQTQRNTPAINCKQTQRNTPAINCRPSTNSAGACRSTT